MQHTGQQIHLGLRDRRPDPAAGLTALTGAFTVADKALAAARERLGEPAYAAAYAAGRALSLEQAVQEALAEDDPDD